MFILKLERSDLSQNVQNYLLYSILQHYILLYCKTVKNIYCIYIRLYIKNEMSFNKIIHYFLILK